MQHPLHQQQPARQRVQMNVSSIGSCSDRMHLHHREPTIAEMLSDPIVKAVMSADGVDPKVLRSQLRSIARNLTASA